MRKFLVVIGLSLLVAGAALAGGGSFEDMPQQQQMALQEDGTDNEWVVPISVAVVTGGFGVVTALVVSRRRKG
jgi:hypothetical protein